MGVTFDPRKRAWTLAVRGLDFADAEALFTGEVATIEDLRRDYGEVRLISAGRIGGRLVVVVWTPRGSDRHIISMRHAHAREERRWRERTGGP